MAKKGKVKISKLKRNNHTTNKMKKRGTLKLQRHRPKVQKQNHPAVQEPVYSDSDESASGNEWADMLDEAEKDYLERRMAAQPQLLSSVTLEDEPIDRSKPRKRGRAKVDFDSGAGSEEEVEAKYMEELCSQPKKKLRALLPIKTKDGIQMQAEECEESENEDSERPSIKEQKPQDTDDSGLEFAPEDDDDGETDDKPDLITGEVVSAVELAMARREKLGKDKFRIGVLCSGLLESPDKKLKNFYPILFLMEEQLKDGSENLMSTRKLATLSAFEVFKDILPDYCIRHQDYSNIKLKKDTLALYKHEKELLDFYKRYLQRLERAMTVLRPKKGDRRKPDEAMEALAIISTRCMCGLLVARPNFNFASNIAQSVIPLLDHKLDVVNAVVTECCSNVFADDAKGEITLTLVRLINQLVKRRGERLRPRALDCLLNLNIKDISFDEEIDLKKKQKKDEKHKKRIINLSKKEKKRAKKLKEVERELLETQAQESVTLRNKHLAEVTKTLFHIYFRILKTAPHSALLSAALNGLSKYTHVINMEFYSDLVAILAQLVSDALIGPRERLLVVRTVLAILAGKGDSLNVDPARFHAHLYHSMLDVHSGKTMENTKIIIESVLQVISRSRRVSSAILQACAKRLATLSLQLPHNGALAALITLQNLAQQSKPVQFLLEASIEESAGSGKYDPYSPSPEHCSAHAASMHELLLLYKHYHPTVRSVASSIAAPEHGLPNEVAKLSPLKALEEYDGSQMTFKPAIPPPKDKPVKKITNLHAWVQSDFKDMCLKIEENVSDEIKVVKLE